MGDQQPRTTQKPTQTASLSAVSFVWVYVCTERNAEVVFKVSIYGNLDKSYLFMHYQYDIDLHMQLLRKFKIFPQCIEATTKLVACLRPSLIVKLVGKTQLCVRWWHLMWSWTCGLWLTPLGGGEHSAGFWLEFDYAPDQSQWLQQRELPVPFPFPFPIPIPIPWLHLRKSVECNLSLFICCGSAKR